MLIINILLIILFFIILFYDINLIEGQSAAVANKNGSDTKLYNYNNLLADFGTAINKINLSKYVGFDLKKVMRNYNSVCVDTDEPISDQLKKKKRAFQSASLAKSEDTILKNAKKSIINTENIINKFLSPFELEIKGGYDTFDTNEYILDNDDESNICSLVDTIYSNNGVSGPLVKSITDEYGNCFTQSAGGKNKFSKLCEHSCHIQENKLEACHKQSIDNLKNCGDLKKYKNHFGESIHIKKDNGLYYNCVHKDIQSSSPYYEEISCIPKNNMCKKILLNPLEGGCQTFDITNMDGKCEDYYMFDSGKYYNCQKDSTKHKDGVHACTKNLKAHYNAPCIDTSKINIIDYEYCKYKYIT